MPFASTVLRLPGLASTHRILLFSGAFVIAVCLGSPLAVAQDVERDETATDEAAPEAVEESGEAFVDEIVVTARRRQENLQEVPVSITAFDADALEQRSFRDISDLSEFTPNLDFSVTGGFGDQSGEAAVFLRGIGQGDTAIFSDPGVGIYVDGVYLARAQGAVIDLLELERVEVLRGPQGTLFGKNTTGGAISLVTRPPGPEFTGRLRAEIGRFDRLGGTLSFDAPVNENLTTGFVLSSTERDGWSRSLTTGQEYHDDQRRSLRATLLYTPSERTRITLVGEGSELDTLGATPQLLEIIETPLLAFYNQVLTDQGFTPYTGELWITDGFDTHYATDPAFIEQSVRGLTLDISRTLSSELELRSITAWRETRNDTLADGDGSPVRLTGRAQDQDHYQVSQELQLTGGGERTGWVLGAIYFEEHPEEASSNFIFGDLFAALEAAPGPLYFSPFFPCPNNEPCLGGAGNPFNLAFFVGERGDLQEFDLETTSSALFGEADWILGDRTTLTTGLRFTRDEKSFRYLSTSVLGTVNSDLFNEDEWDDWSGRVSLAHRTEPGHLLFATVSRGFKSGGFNGRPQQRQALDPFDPEIVQSYEIGFKGDFYDRKLRVNSAAFWSDYQDIHFAASLDVDGLPVFVTQNAGDAEIWGFEVEAQGYLSDTVFFLATLAHLDNELTRLDPRVPPTTVDIDNRLPRSPEWSYSLSLQVSEVVANAGVVIGRVDWSWRDDYFQDFANTAAIAQEAYGLLNVRVTFAPLSERWDDFEFAVFGSNLTDESYLESGFFASAFGVNLGIAADPRLWGVEATWRF